MPQQNNKFEILIPSYCPPENFPKLILKLQDLGFDKILVVNDGSPESYRPIFDHISRLNVTILNLKENSGKGKALKEGIQFFVNSTSSDYIITCDDDGQHLPEDIYSLATQVNLTSRVYLGTRSFGFEVPLKSYIGNKFMKFLFFMMTGKSLRDTQTGLRCFHKSLLNYIIRFDENGFSFETVVLLDLLRKKEPITEIPITTVYLDGNTHTRFKWFNDSLNVIASSILNARK